MGSVNSRRRGPAWLIPGAGSIHRRAGPIQRRGADRSSTCWAWIDPGARCVYPPRNESYAQSAAIKRRCIVLLRRLFSLAACFGLLAHRVCRCAGRCPRVVGEQEEGGQAGQHKHPPKRRTLLA
eukprot:1914129-Prymnesium_polylepis.1